MNPGTKLWERTRYKDPHTPPTATTTHGGVSMKRAIYTRVIECGA